MTVDWLTPAHGLRVDIPTRAEISRRHNGEVYNDTYQVVVSGVFADGQYDTKKDGDTFIIKLGDPDIYLTGKQVYRFSYLFDPGDDGRPEFEMCIRDRARGAAHAQCSVAGKGKLRSVRLAGKTGHM